MVAINHKFTSAKTDGSDASLLRPSNWNDTHAIVTAATTNVLLGRASAGAGAVEELTTSAAVIALLASADLATFLANLGISPPTTGDGRLTLKTTPASGWLMMDDGTFGDASSGASNRANADTSPLFLLLYNNVSDAGAQIFTSTGSPTTRAAQGTAAAAYAAHCRMALPKQLGRAITGAGTGSGLTARPLGATFGGDTATLVLSNLPPITPTGNVATSVAKASGAGSFLLSDGSADNSYTAGGSGKRGTDLSATLTATSTFTGTGGGGTSTPFSLAQASAAWNVMVKL